MNEVPKMLEAIIIVVVPIRRSVLGLDLLVGQIQCC